MKKVIQRIMSCFAVITIVINMLYVIPKNNNTVFAFGEIFTVTVDTSSRPFQWPVPSSNSISSCFKDGRNHNAIDITASKGQRINVAASGKVMIVKTGCTHNSPSNPCKCNGSAGNYLVIEHQISGKKYWTCYMHMTDVIVKVGDFVNRGEQIGTIGTTGASSGYHLDFSIRTGSSWTGTRLDPGYYTTLPSTLKYTGSSPSCCLTYLHSIATSLNPIDKHTVTIYYNANGGTVASDSNYYIGSNNDLYRKSDNKLMGPTWEEGYKDENGLINASTLKLTRSGYYFLGWSLTPNAEKIFDQNDNSVSANDLFPDVTKKNGTVTLYARWGGHVMSENEGAGQTIPDGDYWIVNGLSTRYLVDIPGDNYDTSNGTNLKMHMWSNNNFGEYDVFTVQYLNNGFYRITQRKTNMCVDVNGGKLFAEANVNM